MGLFRGAVFRHGGGALEQPIKAPTETPTSTLAFMGRFLPLNGPFSDLNGAFHRFRPKGPFYLLKIHWKTAHKKRGIKRFLINGGVSNGGVSRSGLVLSFLSFLGLSRFSRIFPICSGMVWGFSRFVPFLFLGLLRAPTRNSPERVCDTIWTFPEKSGKPPGLETPGLASLNRRDL